MRRLFWEFSAANKNCIFEGLAKRRCTELQDLRKMGNQRILIIRNRIRNVEIISTILGIM